MTTATVFKKVNVKGKKTVTLPVAQYNRLVEAAIPTYYLTGKAAADLDKLVREGLRDHAEGKIITASSIRAALVIRGRQARKKR